MATLNSSLSSLLEASSSSWPLNFSFEPPDSASMDGNVSWPPNSTIADWLGECFSVDQTCNSINTDTVEGPLYLSRPIFGYLFPLLFLTTAIVNTLIIIVLSKKHMKSPTNSVLLAMAVSDLLTIVFPAPWYFYIYTLGNKLHHLSSATECMSHTVMTQILPQIFHTASNWLTLLLAIQRYIYVCLPNTASTWCTIPRTIRFIISIIVVAVVHQITRFVDRSYDIVDTPHNGYICRFTFSTWIQNIGLDLYFNLFFWFRVIFVNILPCVSLVVLNILLFKAMREAQKRRDLLFRASMKSKVAVNTGQESKKLRDTNNTTLMLIVVISVFLAVELPMGVTVAIHVIASSIQFNINYTIMQIIKTIINFLIILSYPLNFGIYCGMSRQFRTTFKELFMDPVSGQINATSKGSYSVVNGTKSTSNNGNGKSQCTIESHL